MAVECLRANVAYVSVSAFLVSVILVLEGCGSGDSPSFFMNGACEGWCEGDQYTVENGQSHKERHCGGDMSNLCGGCPYCGGSVPAPSPGSSNSCLCVFDIDRTLTAKQGTANECPGSRETQYWDDAYDDGNAVLSAFAAAGIQATFCGNCYLGICSHGHASGADSDWANYLMNTVVRSDVHDTFMEKIPEYKKWSYGTDVHSPYVLKTENGQKQVAVENMRQWYGRHGASIDPSEVYFFGDHTSNIPPFASKNFNAREISCDSREGDIGRCGALSEEIRNDKGIHSCR